MIAGVVSDRATECMMFGRVLAAVIVCAGSPATSSWADAPRPANSPASEPHLVTISDIVVPIIDANRLGGRLSFDIVIDAVDASAAGRLTAASARLRSTIITSGLEFSRLYASGSRPVDAEELALEMTRSLRATNADIDRVLVVKLAAGVG